MPMEPCITMPITMRTIMGIITTVTMTITMAMITFMTISSVSIPTAIRRHR